MAILVSFSAIATRGWLPRKNRTRDYTTGTSNKFDTTRKSSALLLHVNLQSYSEMDVVSLQAVADLLKPSKDEDDDDIDVCYIR